MVNATDLSVEAITLKSKPSIQRASTACGKPKSSIGSMRRVESSIPMDKESLHQTIDVGQTEFLTSKDDVAWNCFTFKLPVHDHKYRIGHTVHYPKP